MTAKDYAAIAAILAGDLATSTTDGERRKVQAIAYSLADYFARENERFDRARFYAAVGIRDIEMDAMRRAVADLDNPNVSHHVFFIRLRTNE